LALKGHDSLDVATSLGNLVNVLDDMGKIKRKGVNRKPKT
jgi:hypothetical protein